MKKICLLSITLFLVCAVNAQTEFTVPTPTPEQKYNYARGFWYNSLLTSISVAKDEGMTVEEFSRKSAEYYAALWDAEMDFNQFTNRMLYFNACISDSTKIVEQSEEKVVFIISPLSPPSLFGSSIEELVEYWDVSYSYFANRYKLNCNVSLVEEGVQFEISQ